MSAPRYNNLDITPSQVAKELLRLARELADATADLESLEQEAVTTQEQYDMLYSQAVLRAGEDDNLTSADLRKAWAVKETHQARLDAGVASAAVKARKTLLDTLKTRVTVGQSVANALQTEINLDGVRRR
jgi:hypothetical protein